MPHCLFRFAFKKTGEDQRAAILELRQQEARFIQAGDSKPLAILVRQNR